MPIEPNVIEQSNGKHLPKPWTILALLGAIVVLVRFSSFFLSAYSWDESLYVLVANAWLNGHLPYTEVWDNKPPGIYFLFMTALAVLGKSIFSIRVLSCIFVTFTCYFLYLVGLEFTKNRLAMALLSGSLYSIVIIFNEGLSSNTEVFLPFFTSAAFYLLITNFLPDNLTKKSLKEKNILIFLIGIILGIGCAVKQVVLFDFSAFLLIFTIAFFSKSELRKDYLSLGKAYLLFIIGFATPSILFAAYFLVSNFFPEYYFANFTANKHRTVDLPFSLSAPFLAYIDQIRQNPILWINVFAAPIYVTVSKNVSQKERWIILSSSIWLLAFLVGIGSIFRGAYYNHYFIQIGPILALNTAYIVTRIAFSFNAWKKNLALAFLLFVLFYTQASESILTSAKHVYFRYIHRSNRHWLDHPSAIAEYIKPNLREDDYIYVADDQPIIYFLTSAKIPTKYAFPPFLVLHLDEPNFMGVDRIGELNAILAKRPVYIIKRQDEDEKDPNYGDLNLQLFQILDDHLAQNYKLDKEFETGIFNKKVNVFRLKKSG